MFCSYLCSVYFHIYNKSRIRAFFILTKSTNVNIHNYFFKITFHYFFNRIRENHLTLKIIPYILGQLGRS